MGAIHLSRPEQIGAAPHGCTKPQTRRGLRPVVRAEAGLVVSAHERPSASSPHYESIDRFRQFVELRDLHPCTGQAYVGYAVFIARHSGADPDALNEMQVCAYILFLRNERHYAPSSISIPLAAPRAFYADHLGTGREWKLWQEVKVRRGQSLRAALSREEISRQFDAVRYDQVRTILHLIYHVA